MTTARLLREAMDLLPEQPWDAVLADLPLPDGVQVHSRHVAASA